MANIKFPNANRLCSTNGMSHEEWLSYRKIGIGGSEIASICGISKYSDALSVWLDKMGVSEPIQDNEAMYWGRAQEALIRQRFQEEHPEWKVEKVNSILQHQDHKFCLANVDGIVMIGSEEPRGLECKTASEYLKSSWEAESVPDSYYLQVQWYLFVTGLKKWHIAALIGGNKYVEKIIERNEEVIESIFSIAKSFWTEYVEANVQPLPGHTDASTKFVNEMKRSRSSIEISEEVFHNVSKLKEVKKQIKDLENIEKMLSNQIFASIGENDTATFDESIVATISKHERTTIDSKRLKLEKPEIFEEFSNTTTVTKRTIK